MHPLLVAGYVLNLVVVSSVFGFFWTLVVLGISGLMYSKLGSKESATKEHRSHLLAFGFVYGMGVVAVAKAGQEPFLTVVAMFIEVFAFTYLSFLGAKKF